MRRKGGNEDGRVNGNGGGGRGGGSITKPICTLFFQLSILNKQKHSLWQGIFIIVSCVFSYDILRYIVYVFITIISYHNNIFIIKG